MKMKREREQKEAQECTFEPEINEISRILADLQTKKRQERSKSSDRP